MRFPVSGLLTCLILATAAAPRLAGAEGDRDFVFVDEDGHIVFRFAGSGPGRPTDDQMEEIIDQEFSVMVHDRLRADLLFEAEPMDSRWADTTEPRLAELVTEMKLDFSMIDIACRSASCRLLLEHERLNVSEHTSLMGEVQRAIHAFNEADPAGFEHVFLITAYDQLDQTPHVKAFLRRAAGAD